MFPLALNQGYSHPDQLLSKLSDRQARDLIEYLNDSKYLELIEWRDDMLATLVWFNANQLDWKKGQEPSFDWFKPPRKQEQPKPIKQKRADLDTKMRAFAALCKAAGVGKSKQQIEAKRKQKGKK